VLQRSHRGAQGSYRGAQRITEEPQWKPQKSNMIHRGAAEQQHRSHRGATETQERSHQ
jgi:hypothetical protein